MISGHYVFMLVYTDKDWTDIGGNKYPIEGYISAKKFTKDANIENGLYGVMWGKTASFPYEQLNEGHWLVVKTPIGEDLIKTDYYFDSNRYKFRNGSVMYAGSLRSAARYILKHKDNAGECLHEDARWLLPEDVAGSKEWFKCHSFT